MNAHYLLVKVHEREIEAPKAFSSWDDAHKTMCQEVADILKVPVEEIVESYLEGEEYDENTCVIENAAWTMIWHENYDWKIFGPGEILKDMG